MFLVSTLILTFFLCSWFSSGHKCRNLFSKDAEEEDDAGGINLDKAKERLPKRRTNLTKKNIGRKLRQKHRVSFLF